MDRGNALNGKATSETDEEEGYMSNSYNRDAKKFVDSPQVRSSSKLLDPPVKRHTIMERLATPGRLLIFFMLCNLLNYFDRGVIAGVLYEVEHEYELTRIQNGLIAGAFMVGFMISAPIFAHLAHTFRPTRLMTVGLSLWVVAAVGAALSLEFYTLTTARAVIGIGEASFAGLAPTYIDDIAPTSKRTLWLSVFFSAIPVGGALGYVVAGFVSSYATWRLTFLLEAALMLPFAVTTFFLPKTTSRKEPTVKFRPADFSSDEVANEQSRLMPGKSKEHEPGFLEAFKALLTNALYVCISLGYAAFTFSLGALSFWVPEYLVSHAGMELTTATTGVGIVTVVCGLAGTGFGGWLNDRLGGSNGLFGAARSMLLSTLSIALAVPFGLAAFSFTEKFAFFGLLAAMEFVGFATTAPVNAAILTVVPVRFRSNAMALNIFCIHLLGDMPSPTVVGAIADLTGNQQWSMYFLILWMAWTVLLWCAAWILASRRARAAVAIYSEE